MRTPMRKRAIAFACWVAGIAFAIGLYIAAFFTGSWLIFVTVVLAALDARYIRIWRYQSEIARSPGTLFLMTLVIGWLMLPWYIGLRLKIISGVAEFKDEYRWFDTSPEAGLIQPWKRR